MKARPLAVAFYAAVAIACGGKSPAPKSAPANATPALPPLPPSPKPVDAPIAHDDADALLGGAPDLTPPDRPAYDAAVLAAKERRLYDAKRLFAHLAIGYPTEQRLADAYNAVVARIAEKQRATKAQLEGRELRVVAMPPAGYAVGKGRAVQIEPPPKLVKITSRPNEITDDEAWFQKSGSSAEYFVPAANDVLFASRIVSTSAVMNTFTGFSYVEATPSARYKPNALPIEVPLAYGTMPLTRAIDSKPLTVAIYGSRVVAVLDASGDVRGLFDFNAWAHPAASKQGTVVVGSASLTTPSGTQTAALTRTTESISYDLEFAMAAGDLLYVEHTNLGYARDSKGLNAYIGAVDMTTGELAWHSAPLVANGHDFAIIRGAIVCGYGFTAEPDFVFVLDGGTGAVRQKVPVKSGPSDFVWQGGQLRVRTYDTDYVFDVK